jgi:hypothetical protein
MLTNAGDGVIGLICAQLFSFSGWSHSHDRHERTKTRARAEKLDPGGCLTYAISELSKLVWCTSALQAGQRLPYALVHLADILELDPLADEVDSTPVKFSQWEATVNSFAALILSLPSWL